MNDILDRAMPEIHRALFEPAKPSKLHLMWTFPEDKKRLAKLSMEQKMEWYAFQFELNQQQATISLSTPEFVSFWKWQVMVPMKLKRFFYRVKSGQIFKRYQHITDMKKKGPHRI